MYRTTLVYCFLQIVIVPFIGVLVLSLIIGNVRQELTQNTHYEVYQAAQSVETGER